ncbi:MAG: VOC family protein [Chitinophagales bacterium]|nr:VOC family protein [Chitinophagaceae bacterium]MCB9065762.1 VOC family protein [Chitinophagales bacterium]
MTTVSPYLHFSGKCEEAFNFYQSALGGEFQMVMRVKDMPADVPGPKPQTEEEGNQILHMGLQLNERTTILGSDMPEAFGPATPGRNFAVYLNFDNDEITQKAFEGLSAGGNVTMPLAPSFWGALFGMCTDKYGVSWMVSCELKQG